MDAGLERARTGIMSGAAHTASAPTTPARTGTLMGMSVALVVTPSSILSEAALQMSLMAHKAEGSETSLEHFEQDHDVSEERRERMHQYGHALRQDPRSVHRLEALQNFLDSRHERRSAQREMFRFFSNPTDLYVALGYILSATEEKMARPDTLAVPELATQASEIRWLMDELEDEHTAQIRAGLVGAYEGRDYADVDNSLSLSGFYGQTVCDFASVNDVFLHIQSRYGSAGPAGFDRAVDFLLSALGADLASHQPSMEKAHLEHVQNNLGKVRLMQNAYLQCEGLLQRWESVHLVSHCALTPLNFVGQLMELRQSSYLGAAHIESIVAQAAAPDIEHEVLFLQEMLTMTRGLPSLLFDGDEGRMRLLDAVQQAVDKAVEREDAWLAATS